MLGQFGEVVAENGAGGAEPQRLRQAAAAELLAFVRLVTRGGTERSFWSRTWVAPTHLLTELVSVLRAARPPQLVDVDEGWRHDRDLSLAVGRWGCFFAGDDYGKQEGFWYSEFGTLNQYVHLWSFADLNERERLRGELTRNEAWNKEYLPISRPMMLAQENKLLKPVVPMTPPADSGNIYELRWYRAQVGRLGEWLSLAKNVLPSREKYSRNVGYWQTEAGQLNEAVHMWVYKDLNERAAARARALGDPEWQAFLGKALPLLMTMQSVVLVPTAVSPMK